IPALTAIVLATAAAVYTHAARVLPLKIPALQTIVLAAAAAVYTPYAARVLPFAARFAYAGTPVQAST
ncbi:MAG: hypothetical protein LUJ25_09525, partial [Firmicutes bacterium]|nr:hypothetical protein [Bacillota bacterium]